MSKCTYIYLDQNGNPSIHYYGVVNELGHTAALENYLAKTVPMADVKFSRKLPDGVDTVLDWLRQNDGRIRDMSREERLNYISMSAILKENTEDPGDGPLEAGAVLIKANELRQKAKADGNYKSAAEAKKKAREELGYDPESKTFEDTGQLTQLKAEADKMYTDQRIQGSSVHKLIEFGLQARNKRKKAAQEAEDYNPRDPEYNYSVTNVNNFAKEAVEDFEQELKENDELTPLTKSILNSTPAILKTVLETVEALEEEYGTVFEVLPELDLISNNVDYKGKNVYGIADIVLYSKEQNLAIVVDLKTKSIDSIINFESAYADNMTGVFEGHPGDAAGKARLQTSGYAAILQNDFGIDVPKVVTIALPFGMAIDNTDTGGELKFTFYEPSKAIVSEEAPMTGVVEDAFNIKSDEPKEKRNLNTDVSNLFGNKVVTATDNTRQIQLQEANIKQTKNGKYKWWDPYNRRPVIKNTKEEVKREIKRVFTKLDKQKKEIRVDFVSLFKTGKPRKGSLWASSKFRQKAAFMLEGIKPETHNVYTRDDMPELKDVGDDIVVFQDKKTNEITIMVISDLYNTRYSFQEDGEEDAKTTMFGTILSDEVAKSKYGSDVSKADTHNIHLFKAGLVAARLKRLNPKKFGKIKALQSMTAMGKYDNFRTSSMGEQLVMARDLAAELENAGREVPIDIQNMIESKTLMDPSEYDADPFWALVELIKEGRDPLRSVDSTGEGRYAAKRVADRIKFLEEQDKSLESDYVLEKRLAEYLKQARIQAAGRHGNVSINNTEAIVGDPDYMLANNAYLALKNMYVKTAPKYKGGMLGNFNSIKTINDPFADAAARNIEMSEQRMRDEIAPFVHEHDNLIKELLEDRDDITDVELVSGRDIHKKLFAPMLKDEFKFDPENPDVWMQFKDPDDPSLSKVQAKYIRWYNANVKKIAKIVHTDTEFNYMYPETGKSESWTEGNIPIIRKINSAGLKEMVTDPKGYVERQVNKIAKPTEKKENDRSQAPWEYDVTYVKQVDGNPGRGSAHTRELLGIGDDGKAIPEDRNIETNPVTILNMMMINAVKKEHTEQAAIAASALDASLAAAAITFKDAGVDIEPLRETLDRLHGMIIHNKFKQEGAFGKTWDVLGKAMSFGLFFGSWRQFVTETSTATTQITSGTLSGMFNDLLFGDKSSKKFGNKDLAWASTQSMSSFGEQVLVDYGWYNSDISAFTSDEFNRTRKKSMWQTKWGFAPIHAVLKQGTQMLVLAQMHKEGVTKEAFELNKETGRWEYREEKDPRFYVYDKDLKFGETKPPETKEEKEKYAFWLAHRKSLQKENAIKDSRMLRPFTVDHLNSIKNYAVRLLGAMDSKQLLVVENVAMGRSLAKFKRWMRQKIDNIYHETETSTKEGKWITKYDDGGNVSYEWAAQDFEGYWQSAVGLVKELKEHGWSWSETTENLSDRRKENLSKLLSDLIMWGIMSYLLYYLFGVDSDTVAKELGVDKEDASTFVKDTRKGVANALGDIMPIQGLYSIATGSPSAAAAIAMNTIRSLGIAVSQVAVGDLDKAKSSVDRSLETWGTYRLGEGMVELITQ